MTVTWRSHAPGTHQSGHQAWVKGGAADSIDHAAHVAQLHHVCAETLCVAAEDAD